MIHKLKLDARYYDESASGIKTFEIRKNDRDYKVGDILELREWLYGQNGKEGIYTGNVHYKIITYVFADTRYLPEDICVLAVSPIAEPEGESR